ncbi:MAG: hypothetical protein H6977_17390 [Gammaproteobacteria bacterium]|nr:hypothetical protein [Gammaproteobacteria bacterium]
MKQSPFPRAALFLALMTIGGPATAAIVAIDVNDSEQRVQASDGLSNNGGFFLTGIPFADSATVFSPNATASATSSVVVGDFGDRVVIDLDVTHTMSGLGGAGDSSGAITFQSPLPVLYFAVRGSYATNFDVGGVSYFDLAIGSYSDSGQVFGGNGTAWNFAVDGGPETISQFTYRFQTSAFGENTSGSGSVSLSVILSTNPVAVPLPAALWLTVLPLAGLCACRRRR